jgi:hypothetical protein
VKGEEDEDCSVWNSDRSHARIPSWTTWLTHNEIPIPLSLLQGLFVGGVVILAPIIAASLLWTQFYRIGSWLLLGSMAGSLLSAIYNHHLVISPDHVSQVSFAGWGLLFQVTAYLMLIVDGLGCWISVSALRTIQPPQKAI